MIYVLDVETTGLDPQVDRVVELAVASVDTTTSAVVPIYNRLVNPNMPIPPEASAVHHITDDMVTGYQTFEEGIPAVLEQLDKSITPPLYVAHNAPFDRAFIGGSIAADRWIDTCRVAKHFYPDAPGYSNQVLRYWLGLKVTDSTNAHRAMDDVRVTAQLFLHEYADACEKFGASPPASNDGMGSASLDRMIQLSQTPVMLKTVAFGKHKGEPWRDVPRGYLQWSSRQTWDDEDIEWTVKQAILGKYR